MLNTNNNSKAIDTLHGYAKGNLKGNSKGKEIWDSDSSDESDGCDVGGCDSFPDGSVMLGKNVALIKDDEEGVLRTDSFQEYLENVKEFEDLRSMFISMILDLKERVKGCEHCETCSQVIELVDLNIRMCKKVSKLAQGFANVFIYIVKDTIPDKLTDNAKHLLNVAFILLVKNSKFPDIQFIYNKFKAFINVDAFEGLALRLAIQKYKPSEIRIMLSEWGCEHTIRNHRPIIRAFHYEKFGIVRTLIELGSSYKYYLQEDLSTTAYQSFQKVIDKYLARQFPEATEIEKEFRIVEMINDFRHVLLEEDAIDAAENNEKGNDNYNPITTDYFLEDFIQYFYETTGITTDDKNGKKKKKKRKNKKKKNMQIDISSLPHEQTPEQPHLNELEHISNSNSNEYDLMNDETFNEEATNEERHSEIIILDSYYSDKITAEVPYNHIHLGNWASSSTEGKDNFWDNHFWNVFSQYAY